MTSKRARLDKLYEGLQLDFKSVVPVEQAKCLVRFHNCTKYNVLLTWIDFKGWPIKYPTLRPKESIVVDTYALHLWFFRAYVKDAMQLKKVLAISGESLDAHCNATNSNYQPVSNGAGITAMARDPAVCPLCRHVMQSYSRKPTTSPCHHYSGEAKLSTSDLGVRSQFKYNFMDNFIYTCSVDTHQEDHSQQRRDLYLVESLFNLKERCFLKMDEEVQIDDEFIDLNLPTSIMREYIQFTSAMRMLNEKS